MLLVLSAAAAMVLWVLLWGLDIKAIDALMLSLLVMILAVTAHMVMPYLPGKRKPERDADDPAPFT